MRSTINRTSIISLSFPEDASSIIFRSPFYYPRTRLKILILLFHSNLTRNERCVFSLILSIPFTYRTSAFNTRMSCPAPLSIIMEEDEWPVASTSTHHVKSLRRRPNMITSQSFHAMFAQEESSVSSSSCPSSPSSSSSGSCYSTSPPSTPEPCTFDDHRDKRSINNQSENDLEEAYDYYTQEFTDLVSLPASYQETCSARPESVYTLPPMPSVSPVPSQRRPRPLTIIRPPPRMSIPVDETDSSSVLLYYIDSSSSSTSGSVYSSEPEPEADDCASNISLVDFEFEMSERAGTRLSRSEACAERLAYPSTHEDLENGRVLRSKWSTSTIGSVKHVKSKSLRRRMLSPMFSPKSMGFSFRPKVPATPSSSSSGLFSPTEPRFPGRNVKESRPKRRTSTSTNGSEASASSEASSGLRRKPIPLELFLKV